MFWSKIWFFVVGTAAAASIGAALTMPRPASRALAVREDEHLRRARSEVEMLLRENARQRVDLAMFFARLVPPEGQQRLKLDASLAEASKAERISSELHDTTRGALQYVLGQLSGAEKPEMLIALDLQGRVVARVGVDEKVWGDDLSGYFLVRDALRGLMRDDLWLVNGKLYRMAAAPVIDHSPADNYVGAIVLGDEVDFPLTKGLEERVSSRCSQPSGPEGTQMCEPHVAFFARGSVVSTSESTPATEDIKEQYVKRRAELDKRDDKGKPIPMEPFTVSSGNKSWRVAIRRLPGEVSAQDGFFAVFSEVPKDTGFMGTLAKVSPDDLSPASFPWILLGIGFVVAIVGGVFLMWWESDKPLRRLVDDAIALGKGDRNKLSEELHRGKFGAVARSVNLALDKLAREAKSQRRDLGAILGGGSLDDALGTRNLPASPPGGPRGPFTPPARSDFALGPADDSPLATSSIPHGAGFEFEIPPPPPPAAPPPPPAARKPPGGPISAGLPPNLAQLDAAPPPPPVHRPTTPRPNPPAPPPVPPVAQGMGGRSMPPPMPMSPPPMPPMPPPMQPMAAPSKLSPVPARPAMPPPMPVAPPHLDDDPLGEDEDVLSSLAASTSAVTEPARRSSGGHSDFANPTVVADPSADLLAQSAAPDEEQTYWRQVYQDFLDLKRKCGESTDGLTFDKFSGKLRANKEQLIAKYGCKAVRFQVYIKDGKAALKATPVKG